MTTAPQAPTPTITPELTAAARQQPGGWVYAIDPELDPNGEVPPEGIAGAWKVSDAGVIEGDFVPNGRYRASPTALGWPVAQSALERATQMARAGLWSAFAVLDTLRSSTVLVPVDDQDAASTTDSASDAAQVVYTAPDRVGDVQVRQVPGVEIVASARIVIDPGHASEYELRPADASGDAGGDGEAAR